MAFTITAQDFMPAAINEYLGGNRMKARIKVNEADFRVEEHTRNENFQCTIAPVSDLPKGFVMPATSDARYIAVTLVKRRMTTFDANYQIAKMLGITPRQITYGGLKDRYAVTAQRIVVEGVTFDKVARACKPHQLANGMDFFIKDPVVVAGPLFKGGLVGNRFTIKVSIPGLCASQIEEYVTPYLAQLAKHNNLIPNAYGRQRMGRRQNLHQVGYTLLSQGSEAAIQQFLLETSPQESEFVTSIRYKLAKCWNEAQAAANEAGKTVADFAWPYFEDMRNILEPVASKLNLPLELQIVKNTLKYRNFDHVVEHMYDEFSLWVGAYQSALFNQGLLALIKANPVPTYDGRGRLPGVPLFVNNNQDRNFYRYHRIEAIPDAIDAAMALIFLNSQRKEKKTYWRQAFIEVENFSHDAVDGALNVSFKLRSGAYATTLLGLIFDIDED